MATTVPHRLPDWVTEYVPCKAFAHFWEPVPNKRRAPWGTLMTSRCMTCGSEREDVLDLNGKRTGSPNYEYSFGYRRLLDTYGELDKDDWRKIYFRILAKRGRKDELMGSTPVVTSRASNVTPIRRAGTAIA